MTPQITQEEISNVMLDEYRFYQRQPRRRLELGQVVGWGICGLATTYLFAAALLGLLAR